MLDKGSDSEQGHRKILLQWEWRLDWVKKASFINRNTVVANSSFSKYSHDS